MCLGRSQFWPITIITSCSYYQHGRLTLTLACVIRLQNVNSLFEGPNGIQGRQQRYQVEISRRLIQTQKQRQTELVRHFVRGDHIAAGSLNRSRAKAGFLTRRRTFHTSGWHHFTRVIAGWAASQLLCNVVGWGPADGAAGDGIRGPAVASTAGAADTDPISVAMRVGKLVRPCVCSHHVVAPLMCV